MQEENFVIETFKLLLLLLLHGLTAKRCSPNNQNQQIRTNNVCFWEMNNIHQYQFNNH